MQTENQELPSVTISGEEYAELMNKVRKYEKSKKIVFNLTRLISIKKSWAAQFNCGPTWSQARELEELLK